MACRRSRISFSLYAFFAEISAIGSEYGNISSYSIRRPVAPSDFIIGSNRFM